MTSRFWRRSTLLGRHRCVCPRLDMFEVRWTLSHVLPVDGTILVATTRIVDKHAPTGIVEVNPATGVIRPLVARHLFDAARSSRGADGTLYVVDSTAKKPEP